MISVMSLLVTIRILKLIMVVSQIQIILPRSPTYADVQISHNWTLRNMDLNTDIYLDSKSTYEMGYSMYPLLYMPNSINYYLLSTYCKSHIFYQSPT